MNINNKKSFFITLTSDSSLNVYPNNTLSHFTTKLPYTLELDENWSVGIVKFACTSIKTEIEIENEAKIKFITTAGSFASNVDIFDIITPHTLFVNMIQKDFFKQYKKKLPLKTPKHDKNIVQVRIQDVLYIIRMNIEFTPTELFDEIFSQVPQDKLSTVIKYLENSRSTQRDEKKFEAIKQRVEFIIPISVEIPNYMCFYSDLIVPQIFGNKMARGMLMHPVKFNKQYENYQNCDIANIQFLPLEKTRITDISFLIADEHGEQINFNNDTFSTMIVLQFQKGI